jgi:hypothetical protein
MNEFCVLASVSVLVSVSAKDDMIVDTVARCLPHSVSHQIIF